MPSIREIEFYLKGLLALFRYDPEGFRQLDLSDRGALRSFWAVVFAIPAIVISWSWLRLAYLDKMPEGTLAGASYFFRLGLIEAINWIVPLILAGLLAWALGIGARFPAIVTAVNWMTLPFSYAYAVLIAILLLVPALAGLVTLLWLALMLLVITAYVRVLQMVCGGHMLTAATMTMVLLVPAMLLSDVLERFLGIYPG